MKKVRKSLLKRFAGCETLKVVVNIEGLLSILIRYGTVLIASCKSFFSVDTREV